MDEVRKVIHVDAPVKVVFEYLQAPQHLIDIWPGTLNIEEVERSPILGTKFRWAHQLVNLRFEGWGECVRSIPDRRISYAITGGIACTMTWLLEPEAEGTKVVLFLSYDVHAPWRRDDWPSIVERERDIDAEVMLRTLKSKLEAHHSESKRASAENSTDSLLARTR